MKQPTNHSVRWGVIGLGRFGKIHVQAIQTTGNGEVRGLCTRNPSTLDQLREDHAEARMYTEYKALLEDPDIDCVSITTHWRDHFEIAAEALRAGKHVFLEKPMAPTTSECCQLLELAQSAPGRFMVGHICRFDPRVALAKEAVDRGDIGRVVSIHAKRNLPKARGSLRLDKISPLMGDGVHDIDLALWFCGTRPRRIYGRTVRVFDYAYPDIGWAMLDFENAEGQSALAVIETNWGLPENVPTVIDARLEIVGTEGKLTVDCANTGLSILRPSGLKSVDAQYWPVVHGQLHGILTQELGYFADCILHDRDPQIVSPVDAARAVAVAQAAETSAASGSPITDFDWPS